MKTKLSATGRIPLNAGLFAFLFSLCILLPAVSSAQVIAAGYYSLSVCLDSTVQSWGFNSSGQLGDGTTINRSSPLQVNSLTGITAVAGGTYHSLFLKN